jgi:hypothetical protein
MVQIKRLVAVLNKKMVVTTLYLFQPKTEDFIA